MKNRRKMSYSLRRVSLADGRILRCSRIMLLFLSFFIAKSLCGQSMPLDSKGFSSNVPPDVRTECIKLSTYLPERPPARWWDPKPESPPLPRYASKAGGRYWEMGADDWWPFDDYLWGQAATARQQGKEQLDKYIQNFARSLGVLIMANVPSPVDSQGRAMEQIAVLEGFPLYRESKVEEITCPRGLDCVNGQKAVVRLAVYVGPRVFKNPLAGSPKDQLSSILLVAKVDSRPEEVEADEAVARRMLESVDYHALAKLIQHRPSGTAK